VGLDWGMSNVLKVSLQETIYSLSDRRWSQRRVARELRIDRETVGRYLRIRSNPAIATAGNGGASDSKPAIPTAEAAEGHNRGRRVGEPGKPAGRIHGRRRTGGIILLRDIQPPATDL
jgi:hypothetical protein